MIAEIASLTALAWATLSLHALTFLLDLISQILNEMSYFHRRTAEAKGNERLGALQWW